MEFGIWAFLVGWLLACCGPPVLGIWFWVGLSKRLRPWFRHCLFLPVVIGFEVLSIRIMAAPASDSVDESPGLGLAMLFPALVLTGTVLIYYLAVAWAAANASRSRTADICKGSVRDTLWIPIITSTGVAIFWLVLCVNMGLQIWLEETSWGGRVIQAGMIAYPPLAYLGYRKTGSNPELMVPISAAIWTFGLAGVAFLVF